MNNIETHIGEIVDYNWDKEAEDYEDQGQPAEGHIFLILKAVRTWLDNPDGKTWTRDQIGQALNAGADLVLDDNDIDADRDLVNLVVNAIGAVLDNPGTTLDEAIEDCYGEDPETVKGWVS